MEKTNNKSLTRIFETCKLIHTYIHTYSAYAQNRKRGWNLVQPLLFAIRKWGAIFNICTPDLNV